MDIYPRLKKNKKKTEEKLYWLTIVCATQNMLGSLHELRGTNIFTNYK